MHGSHDQEYPNASSRGALPLPYLSARVTSGALVGHERSYAPLCCRTSQCSKTFVPL